MCRARGALSKNQWLELDCTFVSFRLNPDFLALLPVAFPYFSEQNRGGRSKGFERVFRRHQAMANAFNDLHNFPDQASLL